MESWAERYGDIVFAKGKGFPWWPSCIVNPHRLNDSKDVVQKAVSKVGKLYTVCYYGDNTIGYIEPKNLAPFDEENKAKFAAQKLGRYADSYVAAVQTAERELSLPRTSRSCMSPDIDHALISVEASENSSQNIAQEAPTKRRGGRPSKAKAAPEELVDSAPRKRQKVDGAAGEEVDEEADSALEEDVEQGAKEPQSDSSVASEAEDEEVPKKKRGRKPKAKADEDKAPAKKRGRPAKKAKEEILTIDGEDDVPKARNARRKSFAVEPEEEEAGQEKASISKRRYTEPVLSANAAVQEESKEERLIRLFRIVELCTVEGGGDKTRALKTMEKIDQAELTLAELKSIGSYARVIKKLSELHSDAEIRDRAGRILRKWKGTAPSRPEGTAPVPAQVSSTSAGVVVPLNEVKVFSSAAAVAALPIAVASISDNVFLVPSLPAEVANSVIRLRATRLMFEASLSLSAAIKLEQAIFNTFAQKATYFESVVRFYTHYKSKPDAEVQELIESGLKNPRALMHDSFEYSTVYG